MINLMSTTEWPIYLLNMATCVVLSILSYVCGMRKLGRMMKILIISTCIILNMCLEILTVECCLLFQIIQYMPTYKWTTNMHLSMYHNNALINALH